MKIRNGFVSNSSSSSFCILGIVLPEDFNEGKIDEIDNWNWKNKDDRTDLVVQRGIEEFYDAKLLGMIPDKMKNDETLMEFKKRIVKEAERFNVEIDEKALSWCTDGGCDS